MPPALLPSIRVIKLSTNTDRAENVTDQMKHISSSMVLFLQSCISKYRVVPLSLLIVATSYWTRVSLDIWHVGASMSHFHPKRKCFRGRHSVPARSGKRAAYIRVRRRYYILGGATEGREGGRRYFPDLLHIGQAKIFGKCLGQLHPTPDLVGAQSRNTRCLFFSKKKKKKDNVTR